MARVWGHLAGSKRIAAVLASLLLVVTACGGGGATDAKASKAAAESHSGSSPSPTSEAKISTSVAADAKNVSVLDPVTVKVEKGTFSSVTVTNPQGTAVQGAMDSSKTSWNTTTELGYAKTYTIKATALDAKGRSTTTTSSFTTLTPANKTAVSLSPNGGTFGVGKPVAVTFDEPIKDKAAAEKALTVTTNPPVAGSFYWFNSQEVHWRPKEYWKPGTKVSVQAKIYGLDLGNGIYGQEDRSSSFTIGDSRIAIIDDHTHMMQIFVNGAKAHADMPVSMGRGGSVAVGDHKVSFWTQKGPHIVGERYETKHMSSASFGLPENNPLGYSEDIDLAVRISSDGEFLHAAPWSVKDQGVRNVSHGCVNLSEANAKWIYDNFKPGDIVDIRNTGGATLANEPGFSDWTVPWDKWVAGSALH